jgi:hypothetical protein
MTLSNFKEILSTVDEIRFQLESGEVIPYHYHVTEVGQITKHYIDCGGVIRHEIGVNFQLWYANDTEHRLYPEKLLHIIQLSEDKLSIEDAEIEVEYQRDTIGKYSLDFDGNTFVLKNKTTACLAEDACGIPSETFKKHLSTLTNNNSSCCTPGGGCC